MKDNAARAFGQHSGGRRLHSVPGGPLADGATPWATLQEGAMPPLMFQLRFHDGRMSSFAYSDLREIHCPDAGRIELLLVGIAKLVITIEGRLLRDLAKWFSGAMVRWVQEGDPRDVDRPESAPEIVKITVEELPD